jgi:hypothetical protein
MEFEHDPHVLCRLEIRSLETKLSFAKEELCRLRGSLMSLWLDEIVATYKTPPSRSLGQVQENQSRWGFYHENKVRISADLCQVLQIEPAQLSWQYVKQASDREWIERNRA